MTAFKLILALGLLSASPLALSQKDNAVVATVNGKEIKQSEFEESYRQNMMFVSDKVVTKEKVINDLINRELGIMRAKKTNLDQEPIVKKKMEDVLYHAQVSKDLEPKLKKIVVTDDDVKDYYKAHPEYRTAHILFRLEAVPEIEQAKAAQDKAREVYAQLKEEPNKFAELANRYSQSSTAANGGDIGFQPAVRLAPEYFDAIKGKSPGHITSPVRTQFGYHIIKVLAEKDYESINTALYKKVVYDIKRDAIMDDYFADLRQKAKIKVNEEHLK
jgi:peptidyl-prolyl cis-trans isomerase C